MQRQNLAVFTPAGIGAWGMGSTTGEQRHCCREIWLTKHGQNVLVTHIFDDLRRSNTNTRAHCVV